MYLSLSHKQINLPLLHYLLIADCRHAQNVFNFTFNLKRKTNILKYHKKVC